MSIGFPPAIVYPTGLDSDRTLFKVYNTSEAELVVDNTPWSEELTIEPVGEDELEIWADNGFANISGELFYYDSVEKDINGKIFKLKRCARNLGGKKTKFNPAGTWVRGFVIAEQHNQLVDAILAIENFVACVHDDSIICRLDDLAAEADCLNDANCPDVTFGFEVTTSETSCEGPTATYDLQITGSFTEFRLDFGDGNFTTSPQSGTHTYAPNATIDPVITIANANCQLVQTPTVRNTPESPDAALPEEPFEIPIPEVQPFPDIVIPNVTVPETTITLPQIVLPCGGAILDVPSVITIDPPIPDTISITPITIPSVITFIDAPTFGPILFGPAPFIPTLIEFGPTPEITVHLDVSLDPVSFEPTPSFDPIGFETPPSFDPINIDPVEVSITVNPINVSLTTTISTVLLVWPSITPILVVDWGGVSGDPPVLSCVVTVVCPSATPFRARADEEFQDSFEPVSLELNDLGIPSEIKILPPEIPDIRVLHDIPMEIKLVQAEFKDIHIIGPEIPIPTEIRVVNDSLPELIRIDATDLPKSIVLDASAVPDAIRLEIPDNFPSSIKLDVGDLPKEIVVVGMPSVVTVISDFPKSIPLVLPENAQIELVYKGGPIPLQLQKTLGGDDGEEPFCFTMVPCPRK